MSNARIAHYQQLKNDLARQLDWLRDNQVRYFDTERGFMDDITHKIIERQERRLDEYDLIIRNLKVARQQL